MSPPGLSCSLAHDEVALCTSATTLSTFSCEEWWGGGRGGVYPIKPQKSKVLSSNTVIQIFVECQTSCTIAYLEHDTNWTICIDPFLFFNVARFVSLLDY